MKKGDFIVNQYGKKFHIIASVDEPGHSQQLYTMCRRHFFVADCFIHPKPPTKLRCGPCLYAKNKQANPANKLPNVAVRSSLLVEKEGKETPDS